MKILTILKESVTFSPEYNHQEDSDTEKFKDIGSIGYAMSNTLWYDYIAKNPFLQKAFKDSIDSGRRRMFSFDTDGDSDHFGKTGTINLYIPESMLNKTLLPVFMDCVHQVIEKYSEKLHIGKLKMEGDWVADQDYENRKRHPHSENDPHENVRVIRIPILKNEVELKDIPEMNISNSNARQLLQVLGMDDEDLVGTIPYESLGKVSMKIRNMRDSQKQRGVREPDNSNPRFMDQGLDIGRIQGYLDSLLNIIDYAQKHKRAVTFS
jgi:hypothetical protein